MGQRVLSGRRRNARAAASVLALALTVSGLSACRTNVGTAAVIDGHRISENRVDDYVTDAAKPISNSDGTQSIAPKPFVIDILIEKQLYPKILDAAGIAAPSAGRLSTLRTAYLRGVSAKAAVEKLGAVGYSSSLDTLIVDVQVMGAELSSAQNSGKNLSAVVRTLSFPVSVNPRYGTWDAKTLSFSADSTAGLPGFLTLQKTAAGTASS